MFAIRFKIWDEGELSIEEREFWESSRSQFPNCPLFHRLKLSEEDKKIQREVYEGVIAGFEDLINNADSAEIKEVAGGVKTFSVSIDLTKNSSPEDKQS